MSFRAERSVVEESYSPQAVEKDPFTSVGMTNRLLLQLCEDVVAFEFAFED